MGIGRGWTRRQVGAALAGLVVARPAFGRRGGSVEQVDVVVVGGGPGGMNAALVLARSRLKVVVIDGERPRHGVAEGVHNVLSRDGIDPWELRKVARAQILAYPGVRFERGEVERIEADDEGVTVHSTVGPVRGRAALLAVGVRDQHPDWPGFIDVWGRSAHHCPYCHGWESRDQALGYVAPDAASAHHALLLRGWTDDLVVFTDGFHPDDHVRATLRDAGVPLYEAPIAALQHERGFLQGVELADGQTVRREGLFVRPNPAPVPLVRDLGLVMDGPLLRVDPFQRTSHPRIWSAGDANNPMQSVVAAMHQGMLAGAMIHRTLTLPHA